jgi:transposase
MGQHSRSEALFYYFLLEDQVPETHLLRLIDKHVRLEFVREQLKDSYSETGRPSIDPELLLRILSIGFLYGVTSERKLVEELRMHLAWRWFTGLGFDQEIPHHSDNYPVDNQSCVIAGVQATAARMSQETVAAKDMIGLFTSTEATS